jgi:hypothetical protein
MLLHCVLGLIQLSGTVRCCIDDGFACEDRDVYVELFEQYGTVCGFLNLLMMKVYDVMLCDGDDLCKLLIVQHGKQCS